MRASVAGLLAFCALIGIPRLAGELREHRKESRQPTPVTVSVPPESLPAKSAAPLPKAPDVAALPKLAPVQLVSLQRDTPPAVTGTNPASPANEAELIPAIQKELIHLELYGGPITNEWSRPVRSAVREFLRKTGSRARHPQPTAGLLTALQAAEPVKKHGAKPPESVRAEERPIGLSEPPVIEVPLQQNAAASEHAAEHDDYLPPWMTARTDQARLASKSGTGRFDVPVEVRSPELAEAPSSLDDTSKRRFHRRHRAESLWKGGGHYAGRRGYYSRRRASLHPF